MSQIALAVDAPKFSGTTFWPNFLGQFSVANFFSSSSVRFTDAHGGLAFGPRGQASDACVDEAIAKDSRILPAPAVGVRSKRELKGGRGRNFTTWPTCVVKVQRKGRPKPLSILSILTILPSKFAAAAAPVSGVTLKSFEPR